jgi:CP family cyanate transporter-like MFS transporter
VEQDQESDVRREAAILPLVIEKLDPDTRQGAGMPARPAVVSGLYAGLLWMAGASLRMTILAVPPLLPAIHRSLHLDEATVGALTALPTLLLAAAAVPGSLLIARAGARRALIAGLALTALAGAVRGLGSSSAVLLAMTALMGGGVAVSQPAVPALVREWFPRRIGQATAAYSNGLLIGEIAAAALTAPLILSLLGGRWPLALAAWSLPVAATALAVLLITPHGGTAPAVRWWPDWRSRRTWQLGLILGCGSAIYFGSNAFVPDYLKATHHADLIPAALTALNAGQLPASILVALLPRYLIGRRWPFIAAGVGALAAASGFLALGGGAAVASAAVLGFCSALVLVLSLALPPLLTAAGDVHRLSAAMFSLSYACAFVGSVAGGAVWDATGAPPTAFAPVIVAAVLMAALAGPLRLPRAPDARDATAA